MDYHQVEGLLGRVAEECNARLQQEGQEPEGEWVEVRGGLEDTEHAVRVLTPEEFDEWRQCVDVKIKIDPKRQPVAFCAQEGVWWVFYEDSTQGEVVARFEKCFDI